MNLVDKLNHDMKEAMKSKDTVKLSAIRLLRSAVTNEEKRKARPLTEDEVLKLLNTEIRKRNESIEAFSKAGRTDLLEKEEQELEILKSYAPTPFTEDEVRQIVREVILSLPKEGKPQIGKVMPPVMSRIGGRIDGKVANRIVREELEKAVQ
ncbi:MAG: GatB/YqeY domain-containing protein [Candidatus Xenobiia bacterium LiM19]